MKFVCALVVVFLCLSSPAVLVNGQSYVSLASWAHDKGFHLAAGRGGEMVLSDRTSRLVFTADSADSVINGVGVRLSFPVAKGGLISRLDLESAVQPLAFPTQYVDRERIRTICLDPGHGGKDTGNRVHSFYWHNEKTYTLELADELSAELRRAGFNVILTRSRDVYVDLPERPAIANKAGADLFISLHFNSSPADRSTVDGIETYCITPVGAASSNSQGEGADHPPVTANRYERRSFLFAYQIQKALTQNLHAPDREVRRARYAVLRDATMPAILIEGGYMTHPVEGKRIFSSAYRREMAAAIVKGILNYQRMTAPSPAPAAAHFPPSHHPAH